MCRCGHLEVGKIRDFSESRIYKKDRKIKEFPRIEGQSSRME
jgi:hypothetical protein